MAYSTPLTLVLQIGFPNQMAKRSTFNPRQRAARKCPNSWTKISRLKSKSTSTRIMIKLITDIIRINKPLVRGGENYSSDHAGSNTRELSSTAFGAQAVPRSQQTLGNQMWRSAKV